MIIVSYNSEGIPTVNLLTIGGHAPIPWSYELNGVDWESVEYAPRRETIKSAWENYVRVYTPDLDPESETFLFKVVPEYAPIIEPFIPPVIPNWDGLYQSLLGSSVYQDLVGLALQFNPVDSALDKVIASINYGDKKPDSTVAYNAFQSAVQLLLYALGLAGQTLNVEQLAEIRGALDSNGFEGILL